MIYKKTDMSRLSNLLGYLNFIIFFPLDVYDGGKSVLRKQLQKAGYFRALIVLFLFLMSALLAALLLLITGPFAILLGYTVNSCSPVNSDHEKLG